MARSKKSSKSSTKKRKRNVVPARLARGAKSKRLPVESSQESCQDTFSLVEPQIDAEGVHIWPFDAACPVDVLFMSTHDRKRVRMNRHGYFEILYLCSGSGVCNIQNRFLPFKEGDLAVIGSTLYHRIECESTAPLTIAALFFAPEFICCDGGNGGAEYLTPFLLQDAGFPHVISANTGDPRQILDLMMRIQAETPATTPRARLAVKTYLKMILMLLVNQYAAYSGTIEIFRRQERALERLRPLFRYIGQNYANTVHVRQAARLCGMSESHFMSFFKQVTGLSFVAYFNHFRIERAQALLANTEETIVTISQQVGFCDQSYFGTVFGKIVGMPPAAYRRRIRLGSCAGQRMGRPIRPLTIAANSECLA
jgi:AraC-like DNA-binding protein